MRIPVTIPHDGTEAAGFLAWVAYPGDDEGAKRVRWIEAALVMPFKRAGRHPPRSLRGIKKDHLPGVYRNGVDRLLYKRRPAVHILVRRLKPRDQGGLTAMQAYRDVLNVLSAQATSTFGFANDTANVGKCFQQSLPALAMALPVAYLTARSVGLGLTFHELISRDDVAWVDWAIGAANHAATVIAHEFQPLRLLVPQREGGTVPRLKSPVRLPPGELALLVDSQPQLPRPSQ